MQTKSYKSLGNITIERTSETIAYANAVEPIIDKLDSQLGALLTSSFEYPGRYTRWDIGFVNPSLQITTRQQSFVIEALNERGKILLTFITPTIKNLTTIINELTITDTFIRGSIISNQQHFPEELRSKQPSIFSILRALLQLFYSHEDSHLGFYGAFGYDLAFQFEPIPLHLPRSEKQRDLVLFLPDEIYIVDHSRETAFINRYEFAMNNVSTAAFKRNGSKNNYFAATSVKSNCDHAAGEYTACVEKALAAFKRGDLFEVVPGQTFFEPCSAPPSEVFRRLRERNPSPYGFLINLGQAEYLVGASPEMYVRVTKDRVETCPISGTIARGLDAIGDANQILKLLSSGKETAELTMCTDVDRNDKSRICEPGSVKVIGRRQIEMYSRLIHTVDHVEGKLKPGYDALDAFLTHAWAVTVTGAPKTWAMQFIENNERSPRHWYGGAVGILLFNGNLNTGLTIRTIRIKDGVAQVRAGATLLFDSIPEAEEKETRLKAAALLDAIHRPRNKKIVGEAVNKNQKIGQNKRIVLVDHQDSFVHTLANYLSQTGAEVTTLRSGFDAKLLAEIKPNLLVLSPGPGRPSDFKLTNTIDMALAANIPIFGVCLGLQGLVEYFGGELAVLDYPMHGKPSTIQITNSKLFAGLPKQFTAGRYHSLYAKKATFPTALQISAETEDGIIMAIEHRELPIWAVQFHPESILSLENNIGLRLLENLISILPG